MGGMKGGRKEGGGAGEGGTNRERRRRGGGREWREEGRNRRGREERKGKKGVRERGRDEGKEEWRGREGWPTQCELCIHGCWLALPVRSYSESPRKLFVHFGLRTGEAWDEATAVGIQSAYVIELALFSLSSSLLPRPTL